VQAAETVRRGFSFTSRTPPQEQVGVPWPVRAQFIHTYVNSVFDGKVDQNRLSMSTATLALGAAHPQTLAAPVHHSVRPNTACGRCGLARLVRRCRAQIIFPRCLHPRLRTAPRPRGCAVRPPPATNAATARRRASARPIFGSVFNASKDLVMSATVASLSTYQWENEECPGPA
jgi:hypothetical protein